MSNIMAKLGLKFTSGNSVPVSRAMITRNEYLELVVEMQTLKILLSKAECTNLLCDKYITERDEQGDIIKCQWCDETKKILEANNETT